MCPDDTFGFFYFTSNGHQHSALVYKSEMDTIQNGEYCERLEFRIRSSLSQLQMKTDP